MKKAFVLTAALSAAILTSFAGVAFSDQEIHTIENRSTESILAAAKLRIPNGTSYWDVTFPQETQVGPLKVYWIQTQSCGGFTANVDVLDKATGTWTSTRYENGAFIPNVPSTTRLRIIINQTSWSEMVCDIQVRTQGGEQTPPTSGSGTKTLVGVLDYSGGFVANARIPIATPLLTNRLEIFVPAYCDGVELIEGSVALGERQVKGKLSTTRPFTLTLPEPTSFDRFELSLIGPQGRACQLPVYAYALSNMLPTAPQPISTVASDLELDRETFEVDSLSH